MAMPEKDFTINQEKNLGKVNEISPKRISLQVGSVISALFFLPTPKLPVVLAEKIPYSPELASKPSTQEVVSSETSKPFSIDKDGRPVIEIPNDEFQRPLNLPAAREMKRPVVENIVNVIEIPGLRFDQSSGYYFAEAGNRYGLEVGELAGYRKENAFKTVNEKNEVKLEDGVGLNSRVIESIQIEAFEKGKERLIPIFFDLTVTKDMEMRELKAAGDEIGKKIFAFNVPVGVEFLAPLSGGWGLIKPFPNVEDNCFFTDWDIGVEGQLGGIDIYFREAELLAEMNEGVSIPNPKTGVIQTLMNATVELGDPLGRISSKVPLEEFSKSNWGEYQVVTFLKNNDRLMEVGIGDNTCKVFILNQ